VLEGLLLGMAIGRKNPPQSSDVINATSHSNEASLLVLGSSDESGEANLIPTIDICNEAMTISDTKDNYSVILKELSLKSKN
jgi:hypothetical protein